MGLTTRHRLGPSALLVLFLALAWGVACVQEIPLSGPGEAKAYLFLDGGLDFGERTHSLTLGRTRGAGAASFTPLDGATVEVEDVATGLRTRFVSTGRGRYSLSDYPVAERAYRVHVATPDGRTFTSAADSLTDVAPGLRYRPALLKRFFPSGDSGTIGATVRMSFDLPATRGSGLLLLDHSTAFRVSDLSCGGLDPALSCYVQDTPVVGRLQFVDLSAFTPGTTVTREVGVVPFDWRLGEIMVVAINVSRYSAAAGEYFEAISSGLRTSDGFFAARPLTPAGNVFETTAGSEGLAPVLGYFGVRERDAYYVPLTTKEVRDLSPRPACSATAINVPDVVNCCVCNRWERAKLERPSWFPG